MSCKLGKPYLMGLNVFLKVFNRVKLVLNRFKWVKKVFFLNVSKKMINVFNWLNMLNMVKCFV